jgi:hypothetical protein
LSLAVQEKLGEVPGNHLGSLGGGVEEGAVVAQEDEHWVRVLPVDLHLLHDGEVSLEVVLHKGINLLRGSALLSEELVAGKCHNFEATVPPTLVRLHHLLVVFRSESSLAGHVHHHDQLLPLQGLEGELLAADVPHREVKEGRRHHLRQSL